MQWNYEIDSHQWSCMMHIAMFPEAMFPVCLSMDMVLLRCVLLALLPLMARCIRIFAIFVWLIEYFFHIIYRFVEVCTSASWVSLCIFFRFFSRLFLLSVAWVQRSFISMFQVRSEVGQFLMTLWCTLYSFFSPTLLTPDNHLGFLSFVTSIIPTGAWV